MTFFEPPAFDLLKFGQRMRGPANRRAFAQHVVDLASNLVQQRSGAAELKRHRELLHDQISRLVWREYIWVFPISTRRLGFTIYPATGYENVLPNSLLGTALLYRSQLNSIDSESKYYARLMVRSGLEWACIKAEHEGRPNANNDMPQLEINCLNAVVSDQLDGSP